MCLFSRHFFFSPNLRRREEKKQSAQRKKCTGSVSQTTWPTSDTPNSCWANSFFFYQTLPVATKVWLFLELDLFSRAKNVLDSAQNDHQHRQCIRLAEIDRWQWKARTWFRFQTKHISGCFVKARLHYPQQSPRSVISTESILAFGYLWLDSVTRLQKTSAWSSEEGVEVCSKL